MRRAALLNEVREVVAREIREAGLVSDPKPLLGWPWPADAEQDIVSALLCGHTTPAELQPLRAEHFFATIYQSIFLAIEAGTPATDLKALANALGARGPVMAELEQIRDTTPFALPARLRQAVANVIECWRARQLLTVMSRLDVQLRLGQIDHSGARAALREYFLGSQEGRRGS